jgi:hypothetical protein
MKNVITSLFVIFSLLANAQQKSNFTSDDLIGTWTTEINEFGWSATIIWEVLTDGTEQGWFLNENGTYQLYKGTWNYRNGILYESNETWVVGQKG